MWDKDLIPNVSRRATRDLPGVSQSTFALFPTSSSPAGEIFGHWAKPNEENQRVKEKERKSRKRELLTSRSIVEGAHTKGE